MVLSAHRIFGLPMHSGYSGEKSASAGVQHSVLCLGRAEVCGADAHFHRHQLYLWDAFGRGKEKRRPQNPYGALPCDQSGAFGIL